MSGGANPAPVDTPQVLLEHHLKMLRLPTFLREYDKVARQCSTESVDYPRYLLRMTELELLDRERRDTERRIQQARFPVVKSLDTFEFLSIPSVNKALVDRVRYSVPAGNPEMPGLLAQLRQRRDEVKRLLRQLANWPPESLDAQRRFGQPHARLFPFLGRKVWTPEGAGTLLQVFADRVIVLLDSELPLCSPFSTEHIEPVSPLERLE